MQVGAAKWAQVGGPHDVGVPSVSQSVRFRLTLQCLGMEAAAIPLSFFFLWQVPELALPFADARPPLGPSAPQELSHLVGELFTLSRRPTCGWAPQSAPDIVRAPKLEAPDDADAVPDAAAAFDTGLGEGGDSDSEATEPLRGGDAGAAGCPAASARTDFVAPALPLPRIASGAVAGAACKAEPAVSSGAFDDACVMGQGPPGLFPLAGGDSDGPSAWVLAAPPGGSEVPSSWATQLREVFFSGCFMTASGAGAGGAGGDTDAGFLAPAGQCASGALAAWEGAPGRFSGTYVRPGL